MKPAMPFGRRGFALIELLVALSLLALLAAMLGSGVALAARLTVGEAPARAAADAVANTQMQLRDRLSRLAPIPQASGANFTVDVHGRRTTLIWVGPAAGRDQPDTLQYYRLTLLPDGTLTLFTLPDLDRRYDPLDPAFTGWTPHSLLRDVRGIDINYLGSVPGRSDRVWLALWESRPQPPDLVRIRLVFAADDPRVWPDLVIRPRTTVNTACRINARSGECVA